MTTKDLQHLARSLVEAEPFAFCGIAIKKRGRDPVYAIATAPHLQVDEHTLFRVASLSKMVTARVVLEALRRMGLDPSTPLDASAGLGFSLRHPRYPEVPVTVAALASHTSGLKDFMFDPHQSLQEAIWADAFHDAAPDKTFAYSNAGYVLLAQIAQNLTGVSFAALASELLDHLGVEGGFNWVHVTQLTNTLPTFRFDGRSFVPKIDERPERATMNIQASAAQFSPQGGLRTSLTGMLALADSVATANRAVLWSPEMGVFDPLDGVFERYGWGLQIFEKPVFYPRPLAGHFGNAYGFNGGAWFDRENDTSFAYALNGVREGDESDAFSAAELAIFQAIAAA